MSVKMLSWVSICEEWNDEDFEDLDPDNSGGELGDGKTVVMISCSFSQSKRSSSTPIGVLDAPGWGKNRQEGVGGRGKVVTQGSVRVVRRR